MNTPNLASFRVLRCALANLLFESVFDFVQSDSIGNRILFLPINYARSVLAVFVAFAVASSLILTAHSAVTIDVDAALPGPRIKNVYQSFTVWNYTDTINNHLVSAPDTYFADKDYRFIKQIRLFAATGGEYKNYQGINSDGHSSCARVDRDLFINPSDTNVLNDYNFTPLVDALQTILAKGQMPVIKTGAVPLKFCSNPVMSSKFSYNIRPPDANRWQAYYNYIFALATELKNQFPSQIAQFQWGVWTEYDNKDHLNAGTQDPDDTMVAYFKLYDCTVAALEDALGSTLGGASKLVVGAHSMTELEGYWDERDFIAHCASGTNLWRANTTGTQLDYLSLSYYELDLKNEGEAGDFVDEYLTNGQFRAHSLANSFKILRDEANAVGLTDLEFGMDEMGILLDPRGPIANPPAPAFACPPAPAAQQIDANRLLRTSLGGVYQSSWRALLFKHLQDLNVSWASNWALNTNDLYASFPTWVGKEVDNESTNAMRLTYKMAERSDPRISAGVGGMTSGANDVVDAVASFSVHPTDPNQNKLRVLVFNHGTPFSANTSESLTIKIRNLVGVSGNSVSATRYVVDEDNSSFWKTWWNDYGNSLPDSTFFFSKFSASVAGNIIGSANKGAYWFDHTPSYQVLDNLASSSVSATISNNQLTVTTTLSHHAVVLYEFSGVKPVSDVDLKAEFPFDEISGNPINDVTTTNLPGGSLVNGATRVAGLVGKAVQLDGTNDYVKINDHATLDGMNALTVSMWVKLDALPVGTNSIVPLGKDSDGQSYRFAIGSSGASHFVIKTTNAAWYAAGTRADAAANSVFIGKWQHLVGTYDGQQVRFYVDGKLMGSGAQLISGAIANSAAEVRMGYNSSATIEPMDGALDEVRIYYRALSEAEINALYRSYQINESRFNLALGAVATADNTDTANGYDPAKVVDGVATANFAGWANQYGSPVTSSPHWVWLNFGTQKTFTRVEIYTTAGYEVQDYKLQYYTGTQWLDIPDFDSGVVSVTGNTGVRRIHTFPEIKSGHLRVVCSKGPAIQTQVARLTEIEVYKN